MAVDLSPKELNNRLAAFLNSGGQVAIIVRDCPVWKSLAIGGKPKKELLDELALTDVNATDSAKDIISSSKFITLASEKTICLARAKVGDLGFTEKPTTIELWDRIKEIGELCPAEIGMHQYVISEDQPNGECFWIAMEQITDSKDNPRIFCVERSNVGLSRLDARSARPGGRWRLSEKIVYVISK